MAKIGLETMGLEILSPGESLERKLSSGDVQG
jgi:hypothetical protein